MPRGGARPGAGRPPGAATRRTREIADQAASEGLTPLDVMLRAMRDHATADRWDEAAKVAALAAPYVHPRLAAVDLKSEGTLTINDVSDQPLTVDEWVVEFVTEN
jgi:hypothetical protein